MAPSRLLIFGGTFDPPHRAHLELPAQAARHLGADRILYVPAGLPPHKSDRPLTDPAHRLAMLRLALTGQPHVEIITWELDRPGPSYTVHTLEHLRRRFPPPARLDLLIGTDQALDFDRWHQPRRILELADLWVMPRPPLDAPAFLARLPAEQRPAWLGRLLPLPCIDLSSSGLRQLLASRPDHPLLANALHPAVLDYIRRHRLYR